MTSESNSLSRWQQDRRAFIEHRVFWRGRVGLADLMDVMGLSRAQASKDLNSYINDHPEHIIYDKTAKTYVLEYLDDLLSISRGGSVPAADWIVYQPDILATTVPGRGLSALTLRNVLLACEQRKELQISYQSMYSPDPEIALSFLMPSHMTDFVGMRERFAQKTKFSKTLFSDAY